MAAFHCRHCGDMSSCSLYIMWADSLIIGGSGVADYSGELLFLLLSFSVLMSWPPTGWLPGDSSSDSQLFQAATGSWLADWQHGCSLMTMARG